MAHYTNVTAQEMTDFLTPQGFKQLDLKKFDPFDRTTEMVFGKRVDHNGIQLTLRVYTGIDPSGQSRDVGVDAMRASLFMRKWNTADQKWDIMMLGGSKRVHRVQKWRQNLQERLDKWLEMFKLCPRCGMPLMVKKGRNGEFFGCTGYRINGCRHSEDIKKEGR
jgi:hypothetical protein